MARAPGGLQDAAGHISKRRRKSISAETLRKKLRGIDGESISMEMAEILTDYLQQFVVTQESATDWVCSLAGQYGLMVDYVPPPPEGGWPDELAAIQAKLLELHKLTGALAGAGIDALADKRLTVPEADRIQDLSREVRTLCYRLERNACRAAGQHGMED
ncbi:hypothetical protein [Stenotrophomonas sp. SMYL86]|uniref:hypothetical protein n=1 Tax=Stenotrophomonas sp. SMYL86 TaxID=3076044 RepID=UPI002E78C918|nr:hypothetical protein [Stenotrophomonas sp. SMYL86]